MRKVRNLATFLLVTISLAGCVTRAGVAEFEAYSLSFSKVEKAAEPLLSMIAASERSLEKSRIADGEVVQGVSVRKSRFADISVEFSPAHAEYFADTADPPFTTALRASLGVMSSYNEIMLSYAKGEGGDAILKEAERLRGNAIGAVTAVFGTAVIADPKATALVGILTEIAGLGLRTGSRESFRQELIAREPDMQRLIDELIASTETIYPLITRDLIRKARRSSGDAQAAELAKIEARRKILAEWVVLMKAAKVLLARSVQSATSTTGFEARLTASADIAADIQASARRIRTLSQEAN